MTTKLSINSKSCTTFTTDVQNIRRLQRHKHGGACPYANFYTFQQDGAPAHCTRETVGLELLRRDTPDFISRSLWPPNSPDLKPVDYTAWGVLQSRSESTGRRSGPWRSCSSALRQQRSEAVAYKRLRACVAANIGHFEHLL